MHRDKTGTSYVRMPGRLLKHENGTFTGVKDRYYLLQDQKSRWYMEQAKRCAYYKRLTRKTLHGWRAVESERYPYGSVGGHKNLDGKPSKALVPFQQSGRVAAREARDPVVCLLSEPRELCELTRSRGYVINERSPTINRLCWKSALCECVPNATAMAGPLHVPSSSPDH